MKREFGAMLMGLSVVSLAACGQSTTGGEPAQPSAATSAPAVSSPATTVSPDEDFSALKATVLKPADVGNKWTKQGEVTDGTPSHRTPSARTPVEYCPGHVSEVFKTDWFVAGASQGFSKKVSVVADNSSITSDASLYVTASTMPEPDAAKLRAAYEADVAACREYKVGDDFYTLITPEGVTSLPSADEIVSSFAVRRYSDKTHKKLVSIGQYAVARSGRVVVAVTLNTVPGKDNDRGKDFSEVSKIMDKQLVAAKAEIAS